MTTVRMPPYVDASVRYQKVPNGTLTPDTKLRFQVDVSDEFLREALGSAPNSKSVHDGYEQPFALVPARLADGSIGWGKMDLPYAGNTSERVGVTGYTKEDHYRADLPLDQVDLNALTQYGA